MDAEATSKLDFINLMIKAYLIQEYHGHDESNGKTKAKVDGDRYERMEECKA